MVRPSLFMLLLGMLLSPLSVRPLHAQSAAEPPTTSQNRAREAFQQGAEAFSAARYDEAITHFQTAYDLDPRGALLLNLAQAHRLKTPPDCAAALKHYELFLASEPYAPERPEVQGHILRMQDCLESQRQAAAARVRAEGGPPVSPPPPTPPWPSASASLWITGVGTALALAGAGVYLRARARYAELEPNCPCDDDLIDRWQTITNASYVVAGVGGVTALVGFSLWLRARGDDGARSPARDTMAWFAPLPAGGRFVFQTTF